MDGIIYRFRTSTPWRDVPRDEFGPSQTVWKRHRRYAGDGTWDRVLQALLAQADAEGLIDSDVSVDATIARASARDEHHAPGGHRGQGLISSIFRLMGSNLPDMASAAPAAV